MPPIVSAVSAATVAAARSVLRPFNELNFIFLLPKGLQQEYAEIADVHAHPLPGLEATLAGVREDHGAPILQPHHDLVAEARLRIVVPVVGICRRRVAELDRLDALDDAGRQVADGRGRTEAVGARGNYQEQRRDQKRFHAAW